MCIIPKHQVFKLLKMNEKGLMWLKYEKSFFSLEKDMYFCLTYIPPEKSNLYSDITLLENFDFFDCTIR